MNESPDFPAHPDNLPRSVTIADADAFEMPGKCVVCGADTAEFLAYTQDHIPVVAPFVGVMRTTRVALPYCEEHRDRFLRRFRRLRLAQGAAYAMLVMSAITLFIEPVRVAFGWEPEPGPVSLAVSGLLFLFLVVTVFGIKPFLYDAFVSRFGNELRIKSRSRVFIRNVIDENRGIVR